MAQVSVSVDVSLATEGVEALTSLIEFASERCDGEQDKQKLKSIVEPLMDHIELKCGKERVGFKKIGDQQ